MTAPVTGSCGEPACTANVPKARSEGGAVVGAVVGVSVGYSEGAISTVGDYLDLLL